MIQTLEQLLEGLGGEHHPRLRAHLLGGLVGLGRHTVTGLLTATGATRRDWTADYRLYSHQRVEPSELFDRVGQCVLDHLPKDAPLVLAMDDSIIKKSGRKIPGTGWRRDPLSPAFHTNFQWGTRVLQLSAAWPDSKGCGSARMIPVDWCLAPTPSKPGRNSTDAQRQSYEQARREANINLIANTRLEQLKERLHTTRPIHVVIDGRFTNRTMLRSDSLKDVTFIGRVRKDSALFFAPTTTPQRGRRRIYGDPAPSPEQLRVDSSHEWSTVCAFSSGRQHEFKIKRLSPVRSALTGEEDLQVVVIAPLHYRLRQGSKLLYRSAAYLLCNDPALDLKTLLQNYLWRWDIEVNFRDEKQILGVHHAQVRNPKSVHNQPAFAVAGYAMLLCAAACAYGINGHPQDLPRPKWRSTQPQRASTMQLINQLRFELWAHAIQPQNLMPLWSSPPPNQTASKMHPSLSHALFNIAA